MKLVDISTLLDTKSQTDILSQDHVLYVQIAHNVVRPVMRRKSLQYHYFYRSFTYPVRRRDLCHPKKRFWREAAGGPRGPGRRRAPGLRYLSMDKSLPSLHSYLHKGTSSGGTLPPTIFDGSRIHSQRKRGLEGP